MNMTSKGFFDAPLDYRGMPDPVLDSNFPNLFTDNNNKTISTESLPPLLQHPDSIEQSLTNFKNQPPSFQTRTAPVLFDWDQTQADRYTNSNYYKQLGLNPYGDNETKYGSRQSFWNVMGNAFAGNGKLAWNTFKDGWKGWGRLVDTLFTGDLSKLMGSPEDLQELNKTQQEIFNKYAIYRTPESDESIFNKQFLGNLIQQGGFALGTIGQFVSEELITMGMGAALKPITGARSLSQLLKAGITIGELNKDLVKSGALYKEMGFMRQMYEALKSTGQDLVERLPGLNKNVITDFRTARQLGATNAELAGVTLNGLRRTFAEANMAFTESRMEAAGTYSDLKNKLYDKILKEKGEISPLDENYVESLAQNAAWSNFKINAGVISIMNRLQFDNLFSTFGSTKRILRDLAENGEYAIKVTGKAAKDITDDAGKVIVKKGEPFTKAYEKGSFPIITNTKKIAEDFGIKKVAWEATKSSTRNMFKWEVTEGLQELIQEGSNAAVQDYYTDLYNGDPASFEKSYHKGIESQKNIGGLKTFLMGALTGKFLSPISIGMEKGFEGLESLSIDKKDRENIKASNKQALDNVNVFFADPSRFAPEWIANTKVQNRAAEKMEEAIANRDKYAYENAKDSAFSQAILSAKKLNMLDALTDSIRDFGKSFDEKQFREAFGVEFNDEGRRNVQQYMSNIADEVSAYSKRYDKLYDKYADIIQPEKYSGKDQIKASLIKRALEDTIGMMATTEFRAGRSTQRAQEILENAAKIPGIEKSAYQVLRTLGDDLAIDAEIALLKSEISSDKQAVPSKDITQRISKKEKELSALENFKENKNYFLQNDTQKSEKATIAATGYLISKNQELGITTEISRSDLDDFVGLLKDFHLLNRDTKDFLDLSSFIASPHKLFSVFSRNLEGLEALKDNINKQLNEIIEKGNSEKKSSVETNSQEENSNTTNNKSTEAESQTTKPNDKSVSEDVYEFSPDQTYMNAAHGIKPVTYRIKAHKDANGKLLKFEYFNKDAVKPSVQSENKFLNKDDFHKYLSLLTQLAYFNRLSNGGLKQQVTKSESQSSGKGGKAITYKQVIHSVISKEGLDNLALKIDPEILEELSNDQLFDPDDVDDQKSNYNSMLDAIKQHLVNALHTERQKLLQSSFQDKISSDPKFRLDSKQPLKVFDIPGKTEVDLSEILRTVPKKEFSKSIQIRVSRNSAGTQKVLFTKGKKQISTNPSPLNLEVLYKGKVAGYLSHPDALIVHINGTPKKLGELTADEFSDLFDSRSTYAEMKAFYNSGVSLITNLESLLGNNKSITIDSDKLSNIAFLDVSPGEYDFTDVSRPLNELVAAGNEVIAIVDKLNKEQPLVLTQSLNETQNKIDETVRLMKDQDFDGLTKNQGRYIAIVRLPNNIVRYVEVVSSTLTAEHLDTILAQINDQIGKTVKENVELDTKGKKNAVDVSFNNVFNDNLLNGRFFLAFPIEFKGTYTNFEITATGDLQITFFDRTGRHQVYVNNLTSEKGNIRVKSFKDFLAQANLSITNYNTNNRTNLPNLKPEYFKNNIPQNAHYSTLLEQSTNVSPQVVKNMNLFFFSSNEAIAPTVLADLTINNANKGNTKKRLSNGPLNVKGIRSAEEIKPEKDEIINKNPASGNLIELKEKEAAEKAELRNKFENENGVITDTIQYTKELKSITDKYNKLKSALVKQGGNTRIALKVSKGYDKQDVEDLQKFTDWVKKNLPEFVVVADLDNLSKKLADNHIMLGRFTLLAKTLANGKTQVAGQIETKNENDFKFHEAFHAVFRLLLTDEDIDQLLRIARYEVLQDLKRQGKPFEEAKKEFQKLYYNYEQLDGKELEDRFLEEYLADRFNDWKKDQKPVSPSENRIVAFFRKLASFLHSLFKSKNQLAPLFKQIDKGKFSNSQVGDNRFTREIGDLTPLETYKIAYDIDYTTDSNGNTIELKKYLSESDTQRIVGGVVNTFLRRTEGLHSYNKRSLLQDILNDYQKLYISKVYNGLTAEKIDRLEMFKTVFSESGPREDIIKAADSYLTMLGYNQDLESEEFESFSDDVGDRRSTDDWNETHSFGGFKSISSYLRKYIQSTSYEAEDEFGNQFLNDETGERLLLGVNAGIVYNGLLKVCSGVTSAEKFIKRLLLFKNENPESGAFVDKFLGDTGLVFNESDGVYTAHKDPRLFNAVFKAFTLFQVDYMTLRIHPGIGMDIKLANRKDSASNQYNRWQNAFVFNYQDKVFNKQEIKDNLLNTLRSLYIPFQLIDTISDEELEKYSNNYLSSLQQITGVKISGNYYRFSVVKYLSEKGLLLTTGQQELFDNFREIEPITAEDIAELTRTIARGENPFINFDVLNEDPDSPLLSNEGNISAEEEDPLETKKGEEEIRESLGKGNETRLRKIAKNNAVFDETVLATSWTNAAGKSVWAHQLPTFHLSFLEEFIKDPGKLFKLIENDPYLRGSYFGKQVIEAGPTSRFLAILKNLSIKRLDGMRQITGKLSEDGRLIENRRLEKNQREGLTYGDFKDRELILALIGLYIEPEHFATDIPDAVDSTNRVRKVTTSRHMIRILEASNTGDTINLPVINAINFSGNRIHLSEEAKDALLVSLENEYNRIRSVAQSIENDKQGFAPLENEIVDFNDYKNEKSKLKGLRFWNFSNMLGDIGQELETNARLKYSSSMTEQQKQKAIEKIEESLFGNYQSQELGGMTGEFLQLMMEAGVISKTSNGKFKNEMLPPIFFSTGKRFPARLNGLHLRNNFQANVAQFFVNDFINTMAINELLLGDQSMSLKDFIDAVKRAKGANASGSNLRSDIIAPELGIYERFDKSYLHVHKDDEYTGIYSGQKQKRTDAQLWATVKGHRYFEFALGRLTSKSAEFIDRIECGLPVPADAIFGPDGSIKNNFQLSVKKVVHYNRNVYVKTSMFVLTKRFTSYMKPEVKNQVEELLKHSGNKITGEIWEICTNNNNWLPWPGMEILHNKRVMLEKWENENKRVAFSVPESASKLMRVNVGKDLKNFSDGKFMELDNSFWRLQAENPSNKLSIVDPTQARQIIDSEQDDNTKVYYRGNQITVGELKNIFQKDSARRIFLKYRAARNQIFSIEELENELSASIDLGKVTPKLASFQQQALENLQQTGATSQLLELFGLVKDPDTGEISPKYDLNHPLTLNKYIQLFLAYFRNDVMSEKVPGYALTLVSDFGVKLLKQVKRVNENNKPIEWEVIPRYLFEKNTATYNNIKNIETDNFEKGDLFLDDLRYHVPEYDGQGNITGYYSEFLMPAHFKELLELGDERIPEAIQKIFANRIPSQDKSFFSSAKLVDFMPPELGSCAMFPKEVIELAGEDFDVDNKKAHRPDFFITPHYEDSKLTKYIFTRYGDNASTIKEKYDQYLIWNRENNRFLKRTINRLINGDEEINSLNDQMSSLRKEKVKMNAAFENGETLSNEKLLQRKAVQGKIDHIDEQLQQRRKFLDLQAFKECDIASSVQEYEQRLKDEGEQNIGVLNNRLLDNKIQLLTNEFQQRNGLLHQAGNLKPIEDIENDPRIKPGIIEEKNVDIDNPFGKVKSFGNNKEGQSNIAPAVNSMLSFTFVNKYGIKFRKTKDGDIPVYRVKLNGHEFEGYDHSHSAVFDHEGNFKGYTGTRIFNVISAIVTAMTDNAKERKAAKLNLNIDAVGIVSNLLAQGFPKEEAIAMILSPAVKNYYKSVKAQKYAVRLGNTQSTKKILEEQLEQYKQKIGGENIHPLELTSKMLFDNLQPGGENILSSYSTLYHFSRIIEQTEYFSDLSQILKLSKGLGTELEDWDEIKRRAERLGLFDDDNSFEKRDTPFDIREAVWKKHQMTSTYLRIALQLEELSKSMIIKRSNLFKTLKKAVLGNLNVPSFIQQRFNYNVDNHIILFFGLSAYLQQLGNRGDDLNQYLDNRLIYDSNDDYKNIIKLVEEAKGYVPDNYLLNFLHVNPTTLLQKGQILDNPNNRKGINTIEANTWAKLDAYQLDKLQNSFIDLYSDQNTRSTALGLFAYLVVKDGTMFKNDSLIQVIPTFMLDELLGDVMVNVRNIFKRDNLQKYIENNADYANNFREVFGSDFKGLIETFYKTYLPHVSNSFYIKQVKLGDKAGEGSGVPIRFARYNNQTDNNTIIINLFDQLRQKMAIQLANDEGTTFEQVAKTNGKQNLKELETFYKNKDLLQKNGFEVRKKDGKWLIRLPYVLKIKNGQNGFEYYQLNSTQTIKNDTEETEVPLRDQISSDDFTIWAPKATYIKTNLIGVSAQIPLAKLFGDIPETSIKKKHTSGYSIHQSSENRANQVNFAKDIDQMTVQGGMISPEEYNNIKSGKLLFNKNRQQQNDEPGTYTPDFYGIPAADREQVPESISLSQNEISNKDLLEEKGYTFTVTGGKFRYFQNGEPVIFEGAPGQLVTELKKGFVPSNGAVKKKTGLLGKLDISKLRESEEYIPDENDKRNPLNCK